MATQLEHLCCFYNFLFLNRCVDYITKGSPWDLKNNIIMYNERPEIIISEEEKNVLHLNEMGRKCDNCGYLLFSLPINLFLINHLIN